IVIFFFLSSRRRHTRLQGDWSSDVCSSDLLRLRLVARRLDDDLVVALVELALPRRDADLTGLVADVDRSALRRGVDLDRVATGQIGRASCRERVWKLMELGEYIT